MLSLDEALFGVEKKAVQGPLNKPLSGLSHDSRKITPGSVFFALPGAKTDGNRHLQEALAKGAAAIVSELSAPPAPLSLPATWVQVGDAHAALGVAAHRFYGRPSESLKVVGITGTNGKTTTSYFLESILAKEGLKTGVIGTVNYRIGEEILGPAVNTTPISAELHRLLAEMRDRGATHVVMEISSHALALSRVDEVAFDAAVFTNLHRDHLDFHKTQDAYFESKRRLFELLERHRGNKPERYAVLNADDLWAARLKGAAPHAHERLYGTLKGCDLRAEAVELTPLGTSFDLVRAATRKKINLRLVGKYNVFNAMAAAAAAGCLGVSERAIIEGLQSLASVPGRLEPVAQGQDFSVLVDYAHTDSAVETVLANLAELPHRRILTVLGCGGERDRGKRGPMGLAACRGSHTVFFTTDNPRGEDPAAIFEDIVSGVRSEGLGNFRVVEDRAEAIRAAIGEASSGDIVLIAGKGHEGSQIFKDKAVPFDDREAAREALRSRISR